MKSLLCTVGLLAMVSMGTSAVAQSGADQPISLAVTDAEARKAVKPIRAMKIILVGDSTTQVGSGWGGEFCARHVVSTLACVNLARGGRSTFSYRAEGSWQLALYEAQTPGFTRVYMLIQFGHNDQPGKPGRSTDLQSEFAQNLRQYVTEARSAGAIPVLVTPLTRRSFKNGVLQDDLRPWAESVIAVAAEMKTPLLDLHATSSGAVQAMGAVAALDLAQAAAPESVVAAARSGTTIAAPKPTSSAAANNVDAPAEPSVQQVEFDYTHLGARGAELFSAQVAAGLAQSVPELARVLLP